MDKLTLDEMWDSLKAERDVAELNKQKAVDRLKAVNVRIKKFEKTAAVIQKADKAARALAAPAAVEDEAKQQGETR